MTQRRWFRGLSLIELVLVVGALALLAVPGARWAKKIFDPKAVAEGRGGAVCPVRPAPTFAPAVATLEKTLRHWGPSNEPGTEASRSDREAAMSALATAFGFGPHAGGSWDGSEWALLLPRADVWNESTIRGLSERGSALMGSGVALVRVTTPDRADYSWLGADGKLAALGTLTVRDAAGHAGMYLWPCTPSGDVFVLLAPLAAPNQGYSVTVAGQQWQGAAVPARCVRKSGGITIGDRTAVCLRGSLTPPPVEDGKVAPSHLLESIAVEDFLGKPTFALALDGTPLLPLRAPKVVHFNGF